MNWVKALFWLSTNLTRRDGRLDFERLATVDLLLASRIVEKMPSAPQSLEGEQPQLVTWEVILKFFPVVKILFKGYFNSLSVWTKLRSKEIFSQCPEDAFRVKE